MNQRRLLLIELNEITWDLIDPLIQKGKLPTFAMLKKNGSWGSPVSIEQPPQLDPWITWTTLHTGRTQADHNVYFLQQPPQSIRAKRSWEICQEAGLTVGVYGSVCSWPPPARFRGFYVPDTFSQDTSTYPAELEPIQQLNLTYTRSVRLPSDQDSIGFKARLGLQLMKLGLSPESILQVVKQLAVERFSEDKRWQRVALQPTVNFGFFRRLYRRYQPHFATFHSNHVAHYQHTYWKAMNPDVFQPIETTERERRIFGGAIEYGYRTADELLSQALALVDSNTVLVVASSMGQKPYLSKLDGGKQIQQVRSYDKLLEILGVAGRARFVATMSDEFNIYTADAGLREELAQSLRNTYIDVPERPLFHIQLMEEAIRVNLRMYGIKDVTKHSRIVFPLAPGAPKFTYEDLVYNTGHLKSGCHDPRGMVIFYGAGIPKGKELESYNNLDFAPTFLNILGVPVPAEMKGRLMHEVTSEAPREVFA
jgi:Type I phosphodiesterase / nucleotide pyrophosphatase